ncbi:MAG: hypothetical protein OSB14_00475 [Planctomycetota bacterium]|nr:hypothetical protein [Planctomycetota bacterium]
MSTRIILSSLLAPALLVAVAAADTIYTTDGHTIDDCSVLEESLTEVSYKRNSKKTTIPAGDVLRIDFTTTPGSGRQDLTLIDRAETAVRDDQLFDAVSDFTTFLDGAVSKMADGGKLRPVWAPAYAAWRLAELNASMGKTAEAVAAVQLLEDKFPEARYIPAALLLKAEAQFAAGEAAPAKKSLAAVKKLVAAKGLSKRWELEANLSGVVNDDALTGDKRRDALKRISNQAGSEFASVRNRAQVIGAESLLADKDYEGAQEVFTRIVKDSKSDQRTLAIAWSGTGDCLFESISKNPGSDANRKTLNAALRAYMRVVVLYKAESDYLARSMVYAGRIYTLMETEAATENAKKLFGTVTRQFPKTKWAQEARGFARKG